MRIVDRLLSNAEVIYENDVLNFPSMDLSFLVQLDRAQRQLQYAIGDLTVSNETVVNFKYSLFKNMMISKKEKISLCQIVFPSRLTIYKDLFPDTRCSSVYDDFFKSDDVIFPLGNLALLPDRGVLRHDTHYSFIGNKCVFDLIMNAFELCIDEFFISDFSDFYICGDLNVMRGIKDTELNAIPKCYRGNLFNGKMLSNRNMIRSNVGMIICSENDEAIHDDVLVIFGDSFSVALIDYFKFVFKRIYYFRFPFVIEDVVRFLGAKFVLVGTAERYLPFFQDPEKRRPFLMDFLSDLKF